MNTARLVAVEIKGFKSFAKDVRLDFGAGMTAVIGPNGSGKSNLAEAIRWVLGEQSIKQLRGKDRTDVIFAGSEEQAAANKATVALTFDNNGEWFPLAASEIEIRRELTRGGESTYLLNGEIIRLIDLQHLLAEAGIGAKSFTVISQGMVDQYLTASPEKRQELFDEATGIKGLQMTLQQAERKLAEAQGHAHEVRLVLEELQPRVAVLERQIQREEERRQLAEVFEIKQTGWLKQEWQRRQRQANQAAARVEVIAAAIGEARNEREQVERVLMSRARAVRPDDRARQELWRAEQTLAVERSNYERREAERSELMELLKDLTIKRERAEAAWKTAREGIRKTDTEAVRNALMECVEVLRQWMAGKAATKETITRVIAAAEQALSQKDPAADDYEGVFLKLEMPLREVASLTAQEEAYRRQLALLPALPTPDDRLVMELRKKLASGPKSEEPADPLAERLSAVREAEIAAEREGSAARAALQQCYGELHELEQVVLRERGSEFWAEIQKSEGEVVEAVDVGELRNIEQRLHSLGEIDPLAKREYEEVKSRQESLRKQLNDVEETEAHIREMMSHVTGQMEAQFEEKLQTIGEAFGQYFFRLFGGGKAKLEIVETGIDITVTPPGKRPRHMALLSGGERALTSLALLMAILEVSSPPFIVLDEVDAALDEANSRRLAVILQEKSQDTQCIIITHNRESMGQAGRLYGVTMQQDGISRVYSVELGELPTETTAAIGV